MEMNQNVCLNCTHMIITLRPTVTKTVMLEISYDVLRSLLNGSGLDMRVEMTFTMQSNKPIQIVC